MKKTAIVLGILVVFSMVSTNVYSSSNCEKVWGTPIKVDYNNNYGRCAKTHLDEIKWNEVPDSEISLYDESHCKFNAVKGRDDVEKKFFYDSCIKNFKLQKAKTIDLPGSYKAIFKKSLGEIKSLTENEFFKKWCSNNPVCITNYKNGDKGVLAAFDEVFACKLEEMNKIVIFWMEECFKKWTNKIEITRVQSKSDLEIAFVTAPSDFKIFLEKNKGEQDGINYLLKLPNKKISLVVFKQPAFVPNFGNPKFAVVHKTMTKISNDEYAPASEWDRDIDCQYELPDLIIRCHINLDVDSLSRKDIVRPDTYQIMAEIWPRNLLEERIKILFPFYLDSSNPLKNEINAELNFQVYEPVTIESIESQFALYIPKMLESCIGNNNLDPTIDRDDDGICDEIDSDIDNDGILNIIDPPFVFKEDVFPELLKKYEGGVPIDRSQTLQEQALKGSQSFPQMPVGSAGELKAPDKKEVEEQPKEYKPSSQVKDQPVPHMMEEPGQTLQPKVSESKIGEITEAEQSSKEMEKYKVLEGVQEQKQQLPKGKVLNPEPREGVSALDVVLKNKMFELVRAVVPQSQMSDKELQLKKTEEESVVAEQKDVEKSSIDQEKVIPREEGGGTCSLINAGGYNHGWLAMYAIAFAFAVLRHRKK